MLRTDFCERSCVCFCCFKLTYFSFQVVINMSNFQLYKIPRKSERLPYYQSHSIEIFDHPVVEKVSSEVF